MGRPHRKFASHIQLQNLKVCVGVGIQYKCTSLDSSSHLLTYNLSIYWKGIFTPA